MAAALFTGTWKFDSSENFEQYMKAIGLSTIAVMFSNNAKPTMTITVKNGHWTIKKEVMLMSNEVTFKLNEECGDTTMDGRKCKSTFKLEGNRKLVQIQKCIPVSSTIIRELTDDHTLLTTCKAKDKDGKEVIGKRTYKKA